MIKLVKDNDGRVWLGHSSRIGVIDVE